MLGIKSFSLLLFLGLATNAQAMRELSNDALSKVKGQGADISLTARINQDPNGDFNCTDLKLCRLAIAPNNMYADGSYVDPEGNVYDVNGVALGALPNAAKQQWLVLKGLQGSIVIEQIGLDGAVLIGDNEIVPTINLSIDVENPIRFKNFGFSAMSIETDSHVATNSQNQPGYWVSGPGSIYQSGEHNIGQFDVGREKGFMGLSINSAVSMEGNIKIFSCNAISGRC